MVPPQGGNGGGAGPPQDDLQAQLGQFAKDDIERMLKLLTSLKQGSEQGPQAAGQDQDQATSTTLASSTPATSTTPASATPSKSASEKSERNAQTSQASSTTPAPLCHHQLYEGGEDGDQVKIGKGKYVALDKVATTNEHSLEQTGS